MMIDSDGEFILKECSLSLSCINKWESPRSHSDFDASSPIIPATFRASMSLGKKPTVFFSRSLSSTEEKNSFRLILVPNSEGSIDHKLAKNEVDGFLDNIYK